MMRRANSHVIHALALLMITCSVQAQREPSLERDDLYAAAGSGDQKSTGSEPMPDKLDAFHVHEEPYKPRKPDIPDTAMAVLGNRVPSFGEFSFPNFSNLVFVTPARMRQLRKNVGVSGRLLMRDAIRGMPAITTDGALQAAEGVSLICRSDSLTAHPSAQQLSLRGIGHGGASRSLALLDGIPLNDPFDAHIAWAKIPRDAMAKVEIIAGSGASAWGNGALGGTVQILTLPPRTELMVVDRPPSAIGFVDRGVARGTVLAGDFGTRMISLAVTRVVGRSVVQILGQDFSTDGFRIVLPSDRGPIDRSAWRRHRVLTVRSSTPVGKQAVATVTLRGFEEARGNGTPYQDNNSQERMAAVQLDGETSNGFITWTANAYAQKSSFASRFSTVNAARTEETPATDQYAVPATAWGISLVVSCKHPDGAQTSGGADARIIEGESRERFGYSSGDYLWERFAGGAQHFIGAFFAHERTIETDLRVTLGGRFDAWSQSDGHRLEFERLTGAILRNERYHPQHGGELSPSVAFVWKPIQPWTIRGNAQQAFRRPTLNEQYRPSREGSVVIESNAALRTEHITTVELGAETTLTRSVTYVANVGGRSENRTRAMPILTLGGRLFWNELHSAVAEVPVAPIADTHYLFSTLGNGEVARQRLNLHRATVRGVEVSAHVRRFSRFPTRATYLYNDAFVQSTSAAHAFAGKRLVRVPRHTAIVSGEWSLPAGFKLAPRVRWLGEQFEDAENSMSLRAVVAFDLSASAPIGKHLEIFITIENLGDARVQTGRSVAGGVVNVGTPRFSFAGLRGTW